MAFRDIANIEDAEFYIDLGFRKVKQVKTGKADNRLEKDRLRAYARLQVFRNVLVDRLEKIVKTFPSINQLTDFYKEMIKTYFSIKDIKVSLSSISWITKKIDLVYKEYRKKVKEARSIEVIRKILKSYYGRVCSLLRGIDTKLKYLKDVKLTLIRLPQIKSDIFTVSIFGFPNIGKTTLLYKLTGSKPEIASYPFTTKTLNLGYITKKEKNAEIKIIQLIDTPGTLNRFEKMNDIERQAWIALKYCIDVVVYIFDPTTALDNQIYLLFLYLGFLI